MMLRSGVLTAILDGSWLREVRIGGDVVLDAVYVAVRGPAWDTVGEVVTGRRVEQDARGFTATWDSVHRAGEIDLTWRGVVEARDGRLRFTMQATAHRSFAANRVGFCLLHPQTLAGADVEATTDGGRRIRTTFPVFVSPHQPLTDLTGLEYAPAPGAHLSIRFTGDLFEMEDHRNWTDPGWKTYCTPLSRPHPVHWEAGRVVTQSVDLIATGAAGRADPPADPVAPLRITLGPRSVLPELGAYGGDGLDFAHAEYTDGEVPADTHAESIALTATDAATVAAMAERLAQRGRLRRVSVFDAASRTTPAGWAPVVRRQLAAIGCAAAVGGGSQLHFAELNRMSLPLGELDFVTYPICPQVHHHDDRSVLATVSAQPDTVATARRLAPGRPIVIGPAGFRPRRTPMDVAHPCDPPDARENDTVGLGWLLGTVGAVSGVDAVVVLDPSVAMRQLLKELPRGCSMRPLRADPRRLTGIATIAPTGGARLLLANVSGRPLVVAIGGDRREIGPGLHRLQLPTDLRTDGEA
jgi:D-apionolactonase